MTPALALTLLLASGDAAPAAPAFTDYPAATVSRRRPSKLHFTSDPRARRFRTQLSRALGRPANFAGHYVLVDWGCGASCQAIGLVDVDSGEARLTISTGLGSEFHADSRLLVDSPPAAVQEACGDLENCLFFTAYYLWDEDRKAFRPLEKHHQRP